MPVAPRIQLTIKNPPVINESSRSNLAMATAFASRCCQTRIERSLLFDPCRKPKLISDEQTEGPYLTITAGKHFHSSEALWLGWSRVFELYYLPDSSNLLMALQSGADSHALAVEFTKEAKDTQDGV